jgi:LDH2 family malate/lactate/ureidoglycolate dehydrogenase
MSEPRTPRYSGASVRSQILAVLKAWGMPDDAAAVTAEVMVDTDLSGIDSHGISMLMSYDRLQHAGGLQIKATPETIVDLPAFTVLDAHHGLGHPVGIHGMQLAIDKAQVCGIGAVAVRNSHHFGALGYYVRKAASQGFLGLVTSSTRVPGVVPTGGTLPVLGTNPLAFAAPRRHGEPFVIDMSTSIVAMNKVRIYGVAGKPLPEGWVIDSAGSPVADAAMAHELLTTSKAGLSTLGGPDTILGGQKGLGLSMMVQILSASLSNAARAGHDGDHHNIGHFLLAIDPTLVNTSGTAEDHVEELITTVKGSGPNVLIGGEPEQRSRDERSRTGIPLPRALTEQLRGVCDRAGVSLLLEEIG